MLDHLMALQYKINKSLWEYIWLCISDLIPFHNNVFKKNFFLWELDILILTWKWHKIYLLLSKLLFMQIYHFQGQNMFSCNYWVFFRLTIKSRFMVLFWNIMSWFRYKVEVFTPKVLYYVKNCTGENMTVMFREILLFLLSRHTRWCKKEKNTERGNEIGNEFYLQHAKILNSCRRESLYVM